MPLQCVFCHPAGIPAYDLILYNYHMNLPHLPRAIYTLWYYFGVSATVAAEPLYCHGISSKISMGCCGICNALGKGYSTWLCRTLFYPLSEYITCAISPKNHSNPMLLPRPKHYFSIRYGWQAELRV